MDKLCVTTKAQSPASRQAALRQRELRSVLGQFATGVTVVTATGTDGRMCGLTVNSFSSVSLEPPLILWCLHRDSPSLPVFKSARSIAISILAEDQEHIAVHFSRFSANKFASVEVVPSPGGAPVICGSIAYLECEPFRADSAGDHTVFLLSVVSACTLRDHMPLIFHGGGYRRMA